MSATRRGRLRGPAAIAASVILAGCLVAEIRSEPGLAASSSSDADGGDAAGGSEAGSSSSSSPPGTGTGATSSGPMAGDPGTVLCGGPTVACAPGEACCLETDAEECSAVCGDRFMIECDGPDDCPGDEACCWSLAGAACRVECSPTSERYACRTTEDCAPVPDAVCIPTTTLREWYNICDIP